MIVIMSKDEYAKRTHYKSVTEASVVLVKKPNEDFFTKVKDRYDGTNEVSVNMLEVLTIIEKDTRRYSEFNPKETRYDTNE